MPPELRALYEKALGKGSYASPPDGFGLSVFAAARRDNSISIAA